MELLQAIQSSLKIINNMTPFQKGALMGATVVASTAICTVPACAITAALFSESLVIVSGANAISGMIKKEPKIHTKLYALTCAVSSAVFTLGLFGIHTNMEQFPSLSTAEKMTHLIGVPLAVTGTGLLLGAGMGYLETQNKTKPTT